MAKETKMAFEGKLYYGVAGSTGATEITNCRDVTISWTTQTGDTTVRGDGAGPPVGSARVTRIDVEIQWTMLNKSDDVTLAALLTATAAGSPVAIRGKDYSSGKGPDYDVILSVQNGQPVNGEQTYQFTATPTEESGRAPTRVNAWV
jgi:hypothetical protein